MIQRTILLLIALTSMNGTLIANTEPVAPIVEEDKLMEASMVEEIKGAVLLYSVLKEDIELISTEEIQKQGKKSTRNWHLAYNRDYFIGYNEGEMEAITPRNFKRIAKKYFANVPALASRIGKRGFRYKNLPTIILFYNKQIIQGKALTKEDNLPVKQLN